MQNTIAVIEAHPAAVCGVHGTRRLGGKSLLEWVVQRVRESARLDSIVVLVESAADGDAIERMLPAALPIFRHHGADGLGRYLALLDRFPTKAVVRVGAANPFLDAALIDRLIAHADENPTCDYVGFESQQGQPALVSATYEIAEWCSADALRRAGREAIDPRDRQQPTQWMCSQSQRFVSRWIPIPQPLDCTDMRLTIEHAEDWEHAEAIFDALGHDRLDWQQIAGFLKHQPRLRERMANLNRRHTAA